MCSDSSEESPFRDDLFPYKVLMGHIHFVIGKNQLDRSDILLCVT